MRFPPSFLDELKARLPVSEVARRRVKLVKAGREWKGLSPFSPEKTPSFFVNDQKQAWFDFSSGQNGSIFDFVMLTEGVGFPEAVERLAGMAGLALPTVTPEAEAREKRRATLHDAMELAATFFEEQLQGRAGARARGYLRDRAISEKAQKLFRIGYAPAEKFALRDWLAAKDVPVEVMTESGLLIHGEDIAVPYDRFRDRVMFPIEDARGRVIAFGGRAMEKDVPAKYLNSPETPLFHKGATLYNLHRVRKAAHDGAPVVAVEGYVDVIAMVMAGFPGAVASCGTALTPEQCELLWRMAPEPTLCFDGDRAGRKAAFRALDVALPMLGPDRSFRFALLPEGQDPDDLARAGGPAAIGEVLAQARPLVDLLWGREVEAAGDLTTPERRAGLERRLDEVTRPIPDEALRRAYREEFVRRLDALLGRGPRAAGPGGPGGGRRQSGALRRGQGRFAQPERRGYVSEPLAVGPGLAQSALVRAAAAPPREAVIVAALTAHPELLADHAEELSELEFSGRDTRRLLNALITLGHEHLERPDLLGALEEIGLGPERARLEADPALAPIAALRPQAERADAEAVLRQAMWMHRRSGALLKELRQAETALAAEPTEANFAHLNEIKFQLANLEGGEAAIEGFGGDHPDLPV
jgi:DNA primase